MVLDVVEAGRTTLRHRCVSSRMVPWKHPPGLSWYHRTPGTGLVDRPHAISLLLCTALLHGDAVDDADSVDDAIIQGRTTSLRLACTNDEKEYMSLMMRVDWIVFSDGQTK